MPLGSPCALEACCWELRETGSFSGRHCDTRAQGWRIAGVHVNTPGVSNHEGNSSTSNGGDGRLFAFEESQQPEASSRRATLSYAGGALMGLPSLATLVMPAMQRYQSTALARRPALVLSESEN